MASAREDKFTDLKNRLDTIRQSRARDEGALEQYKQRLKKEFGCDTLEAARKKHAAMKKQIEDDEVTIDQELETLEAEVSTMEEALNG